MADWNLKPGEYTTRARIQGDFGGSGFSGIETPTTSPNVLIYSDPAAGGTYGYDYDGWSEDGSVFLYTGKGAVGDQQLAGANAALANHKQTDRALRVFVADGYVEKTKTRRQLYIGEFEVGDDRIFFPAPALDVEQNWRTVLVFRLRPTGAVVRRPVDASKTGEPPNGATVEIENDPAAVVDAAAVIDATEVEGHHTSTFEQASPGQPVVAIRREAELVRRYREHLQGLGLVVRSRRIRPPGEANSLRTDLYVESTDELCEAKGVTTRETVRSAVGQVLDYRRHLQPKSLAVLLPTRPTDDLVAFMHSVEISCVYEERRGVFKRLDP